MLCKLVVLWSHGNSALVSQGEGANSGRVDSGGTGGAGKADDVAMSEEVAHIKRIQVTKPLDISMMMLALEKKRTCVVYHYEI